MSSSIPTIKDFLFPVLKVFAEAEGPIKRREAARRAADLLGLSEEQRAEALPSGKHLVYRHRAGWATNELKHAGFVHRPSPAYWTATEEGRAFYEEHKDGLSERDLVELRRRVRAAAKRAGVENGDGRDERDSGGGVDANSPEEQIEAAIYELRQSVATELLERLHGADPDFFEQVVLDVLHAMGYGASDAALRPVGGVSDGGIDGIISLDRLGLEKVYVQSTLTTSPTSRAAGFADERPSRGGWTHVTRSSGIPGRFTCESWLASSDAKAGHSTFANTLYAPTGDVAFPNTCDVGRRLLWLEE